MFSRRWYGIEIQYEQRIAAGRRLKVQSVVEVATASGRASSGGLLAKSVLVLSFSARSLPPLHCLCASDPVCSGRQTHLAGC